MAAYLEKAKGLMKKIPTVSIDVILQSRDAELLDAVSIEFLAEPNIKQQPKIMELI